MRQKFHFSKCIKNCNNQGGVLQGVQVWKGSFHLESLQKESLQNLELNPFRLESSDFSFGIYHKKESFEYKSLQNNSLQNESLQNSENESF